MTWILLLLAIGCVRPPAGLPPGFDAEVADVNEPTVMWGYSWVDPDVLAVMPMPSADDLHRIAADGVDLLITLTENPLDKQDLEDAGLASLHLPIRDFEAPTEPQMHAFVEAVEARIAAGDSVGVHCLAGRGRSGTMAAIWFVHEGMDAASAIAAVRELRPGSIESTAQEQAVHDYEAMVR